MLQNYNNIKSKMVYIKKVKPNGNITDDRKAYNKAYYQANKVAELAKRKAYYQAKKFQRAELIIEETGEIIVWIGLDFTNNK